MVDALLWRGQSKHAPCTGSATAGASAGAVASSISGACGWAWPQTSGGSCMPSCCCSTGALHAINTVGCCEPAGRRWKLLAAYFVSVVIECSGRHVHPNASGSRTGMLLNAFAGNIKLLLPGSQRPHELLLKGQPGSTATFQPTPNLLQLQQTHKPLHKLQWPEQPYG